MSDKISVLFVCLGNICRSPMGEGVFQSMVKQSEWKDKIETIDSCGTGMCPWPMYTWGRDQLLGLTEALAAYHTGEPPDERTMSTLAKNGITDYKHLARRVRLQTPGLWSLSDISDRTQFELTDLDEFDYVFAMDRSNLADLQSMAKQRKGAKAKVMLFGEYSGKDKAEVVVDPYYGGLDGFATAYEQCTRFSENFLNDVFGSAKP